MHKNKNVILSNPYKSSKYIKKYFTSTCSNVIITNIKKRARARKEGVNK